MIYLQVKILKFCIYAKNIQDSWDAARSALRVMAPALWILKGLPFMKIYIVVIASLGKFDGILLLFKVTIKLSLLLVYNTTPNKIIKLF